MLSNKQIGVVSNFLLDSAKIIFGSLVIGVFVPSASGNIPWITLVVGILMTLGFLTLSARLAKTLEI